MKSLRKPIFSREPPEITRQGAPGFPRFDMRYSYILLVLLLGSCTTPKKVGRFLSERPTESAPLVKGFLSLNPLFAASYCADEFPVQETSHTRVDTVIREVVIPGDSVACPEVTDLGTGRRHTPKVKCPDVKHQERTVREQVIKVRENTARVRALELEKQQLIQELIQEKKAHTRTIEEKQGVVKERNAYLKAFLFLALAMAAFIALKVFKPF
jgi:hypothetical protein